MRVEEKEETVKKSLARFGGSRIDEPKETESHIESAHSPDTP